MDQFQPHIAHNQLVKNRFPLFASLSAIIGSKFVTKVEIELRHVPHWRLAPLAHVLAQIGGIMKNNDQSTLDKLLISLIMLLHSSSRFGFNSRRLYSCSHLL